MTYTAIRKSDENTKEYNLSEPEQIIKAQLKSWIDDVQKKAELEHRLKMVFQNTKSHTKSLSQL